MGAIATQITSLTIVYSAVYSGTDQSKHQSSASLAFVWGIYRGPVNSPHKWPVTRKMFPFDNVIMAAQWHYMVSGASISIGWSNEYSSNGRYEVITSHNIYLLSIILQLISIQNSNIPESISVYRV